MGAQNLPHPRDGIHPAGGVDRSPTVTAYRS